MEEVPGKTLEQWWEDVSRHAAEGLFDGKAGTALSSSVYQQDVEMASTQQPLSKQVLKILADHTDAVWQQAAAASSEPRSPGPCSTRYTSKESSNRGRQRGRKLTSTEVDVSTGHNGSQQWSSRETKHRVRGQGIIHPGSSSAQQRRGSSREDQGPITSVALPEQPRADDFHPPPAATGGSSSSSSPSPDSASWSAGTCMSSRPQHGPAVPMEL
eukprot:GSA25T00025454001.1